MNIRRWLPLRALLVVIALTALAGPARARTVMVLPIQGQATLAAELRRVVEIPGFTVQDGATTSQALAAAAVLGTVCAPDTAGCMAKLGAVAVADLVIGGSVDGGASPIAHLMLVDVASGQRRGEASLALPDASSAVARAHAVKLLVVRLVAPEDEVGTLVLNIRPAHATVRVDRKPRTWRSDSPPLQLKPGPHELTVDAAGYESHTETVQIEFATLTSRDVALVPVESDAPVVDKHPAETDGREHLLAVDFDTEAVDPAFARSLHTMLLDRLEESGNVRVSDGPRQLTDTTLYARVEADDAGTGTLTLKAVGTRTGMSEGSAQRRLPFNADEARAAIDEAVSELYGMSTNAPLVAAPAERRTGLPTWVFTTGAVVTGVGLVGTGALAAAWLATGGGDSGVGRALGASTLAVGGITAACGVATGAVAVFTEWRD